MQTRKRSIFERIISGALALNDMVSVAMGTLAYDAAAYSANAIPVAGVWLSRAMYAAQVAYAATGGGMGPLNNGDYLHIYRSTYLYFNHGHCHGSKYTHYYQVKAVVRRKDRNGSWYSPGYRYLPNLYQTWKGANGWTPLYDFKAPKPTSVRWV